MINGKKIKHCLTLKSMYDNNSISVMMKVKGIRKGYPEWKEYRMHVNEITKMMKNFKFDVEKKRVWDYLIVREE